MLTIKQIAEMVGLAACGLALGSCAAKQHGGVAAPDYQAPVSASAAPADVRAICYTESEFSAIRVRMAQGVLATAVLQCQAPDGSRVYEQKYEAFLVKFKPELLANAKEIQAATARKHVNLDVMVTQFANRTAGRASEPGFCARQLRAFEWALSPKVTTLKQVPSPYDFGPDMQIFPCPSS